MMKHTVDLKKNLMIGPTFVEIVGAVVGLFLSARNAMQVADLAEKCTW